MTGEQVKLTPLALATLGLIREGKVSQINCGTVAWRIDGADPSVLSHLVMGHLAAWAPPYSGKTIAATLTAAGEAAWAAATAGPAAPQNLAKYEVVLGALQEIAATPKEGEPCPEDPRYQQSWSDENGRYAIDKLHELIDLARKVAGVPAPPAASDLFSSPVSPTGE
ncbi:hypothetical protein [Xanthobacter flavus]|uniref:hypothetical protein n=1 Tax=Xanthobacter flavus TaxID=281 RepID=UPI0037290B95